MIRWFRILWAKISGRAYYDEQTDHIYAGRDVWNADVWLAIYCPAKPESEEDEDGSRIEI